MSMNHESNQSRSSKPMGDDGNQAVVGLTQPELGEMRQRMVARLKGTDDIETRWNVQGRKWATDTASVHELNLNERDLEEFGDQIWAAADFSGNDFAAMFVRLLRKPADVGHVEVLEFWEAFSGVYPENCEVVWFREGAADAWDEAKQRVNPEGLVPGSDHE